MIPVTGGQDSAQPSRARRVRKPAKRHNAERSIRVVVTPDGTFAPFDRASQKICRDRGMRVGRRYISFIYEVRDEDQWAKAHQVGTFLAENVDRFSGMSSHAVLKELQRESGIGCEKYSIDLGALGKHDILVPKSFAFGWMDNTEWTEIWRGLCDHIGRTYFGMIEADVVEQMERLMLREPAA